MKRKHFAIVIEEINKSAFRIPGKSKFIEIEDMEKGNVEALIEGLRSPGKRVYLIEYKMKAMLHSKSPF